MVGVVGIIRLVCLHILVLRNERVLVCFLIRVTLLVNNVMGLLVLLPFFFIIRQLFVLKEEVQMQETFGDDYAEFKARIRRWI